MTSAAAAVAATVFDQHYSSLNSPRRFFSVSSFNMKDNTELDDIYNNMEEMIPSPSSSSVATPLSAAASIFASSASTFSPVVVDDFPDGAFWVEGYSHENNNLNTTHHVDNGTTPELPIDMQFNEGHQLAIVVYSILMIVSAIGNLSVLSAIIKLRIKGRLTRINMFLLHLVLADCLVTFLMMPLEIVWNATVSWYGGDAMCRIMSFFRIFGLYLSGFILVCISLDRYFAVLKPLAIPEANSRGKIMLAMAWIASVICSLPQSFIFHVERHPVFTWYEQCVTFNSFPSEEYELAYNFFGFVFLYGVPLVMIIFCYSRILFEIYRINALKRNEDELRRSNMGALGRAKIRTLKMTVLIVATYSFLWLPYNIMSLWYWLDRKSAQEVDQRIQKGLFLFACTNSCVNPLIYGLFHFRPRKAPSSITVPRSLPNGYHRPPVASEPENYKMRVRWRPNECCIVGCGSSGSGSNNDTLPNGSSLRGNHHHPHHNRRPTQQYWMGNSIRKYSNNGNFTTESTKRRDVTIAVANGTHHHHHHHPCSTNNNVMMLSNNGNRFASSQHHHHHHNGHRRCSNFQMTDTVRQHASQSQPVVVAGGDNHNVFVGRHNFIDDKNSKRTFLSSVL